MDTINIPFEKFVLDNGLTVIVHEDHKAPVVAVSIWFRVGSADEPAGQTGFAHLFEHLMFSGSEHHWGSYLKPFELVGATDINGTTWFDRTNYFETVPTTALDMALWMESDRMGHLLGAIGQDELDTQRGVVQNEKRQNENQPYGRTEENILRNAFPANHPYRHTTIGSMEDLNAASLEDVRQWFGAYYGAANTTLVLAGDITPAQARAKVARYFGDIPAGPPVMRPAAWVAPRQASTRGTQVDQVAQVRIIREWNVPQLGEPDNALLELAAEILGGGKASRLYRRLVQQDKLADGARVSLSTFTLASQFRLTVDVKNGVDPALVESVVAQEWLDFLQQGPSDDELARAKTHLRAGFVRGLEKVGGFSGKAQILAEGQVYRGDPAAYQADLAQLATATPASVRAAAQRWLARGDYTLSVLPAGSPAAVAAADEGEGLPAADDKPAAITMPSRTHAPVASEVDRHLGVPEVTQYPNLSFPEVRRTRLSNGLTVVLAERHSVPMTLLTLQFQAGYAADHGHRPGTAAFVASLFSEGSAQLSSTEVAETLQRLGTQLSARVNLDSTEVALNMLDSGLAPSIALLAGLVRAPAFREVDIESIRARRLAALEQERTRPSALGPRLLPPLMYGPAHPYGVGLSGMGTEAAIRGVTAAELKAFHEAWIRPEHATIFVVGDTTLEAILPLLEQAFGDWAPAAQAPPAVELPVVVERKQPRLFLVDRAGSSQSQIFAARLVAPTTAADYLPKQTANAVFGGTFTSRLNMNLREDKRWAYGASSYLLDALGQRLLLLSVAVQADKTAESVVEMLAEVAAISGRQPPTEAEIDKIKTKKVRGLPGSFEASGAVLDTLLSNHRYGRRDDYASTLKQAVEAQSEAQVQAAAQQLFVAEAMTWLVVGDLSQIEQPLRALPFGEVSVLDAEGNIVG